MRRRGWVYLSVGLIAVLCFSSLQAGAQQSHPEQPPASQGETPKTGDRTSDDQTSDEKKDPSTNPASLAAEKTKQVTIQAAEVTKNLGELSLIRARNWESGFLTGVYVEKDHHMTPLTGREREEIYLRQTLATPGAYMKRMFAAGIDQARGAPSQWDDGWGGYAERFASREGQFISANSLAALGNAALRYEPRYDVCRCAGFWARSRHAIVRNFITYNQSEVEMRPQLALYGGAFGGGLISTAWKPHPRNAFAEGGRAMAGQAAYGALLNFFIEFSADINRKIGAQK